MFMGQLGVPLSLWLSNPS